MAAGGAHITGTLSSTTSHPSVFELVSQESFGKALRPAVHHIIKSLAEKYPAGNLPVFYRRFDELYLAIDTFVQWHYILTRGATLNEAFYGLERKLDDCPSRTSKLTRIRISYAASVLVPYLISKLEDARNKYVIERVQSQPEVAQPLSNISNVPLRLLSLYPYFKTTISTINLYYLLSFTFGYSEYHNLFFRLLGMKLVYSSSERLKFVEEKAAEIFQPELWKNPRNIPVLLLRALGESAMFSVEMGSFFVQFLEWWYNDDSKQRIALTALPVPPAPHAIGVPVDQNKCPLCRQPFKNPTALSTSGLVYCYGCIVPYLNQEHKCPVTSLCSNNQHLIRIF